MMVLARITVGWPMCSARRLEGGVDLAVVVAAARAASTDLVVGHVLDHLAQCAGRGRRSARGCSRRPRRGRSGTRRRACVFIRLTSTPSTSRASSGVPLAAPDDLDDVPAGAAEERLELLDDLAVAAHRAVELLQVAVDDEGEVVELLAGGEPERAERLGLVHLAVAEERPDVLLAGVLDAAVVQVAVEPRLVDRVDRAEAHRDGRELPEVRHQPRVRVGRTGPACRRRAGPPGGSRRAASSVEPALEEGAGVDAGGGVALDVDLVAAAGVVLAAEEVVEADLVERRGGRVRRDVAADLDAGALGAVHHDRGVPADEARGSGARRPRRRGTTARARAGSC